MRTTSRSVRPGSEPKSPLDKLLSRAKVSRGVLLTLLKVVAVVLSLATLAFVYQLLRPAGVVSFEAGRVVQLAPGNSDRGEHEGLRKRVHVPDPKAADPLALGDSRARQEMRRRDEYKRKKQQQQEEEAARPAAAEPVVEPVAPPVEPPPNVELVKERDEQNVAAPIPPPLEIQRDAMPDEEANVPAGAASPPLLLKPELPLQAPQPPLEKTIKTLDQHMYTQVDTPFFDENVGEFRARMKVAMQKIRKGTIFVALGSFRDELCAVTMLQAFERANKPDRVFVGLVDQVHLQNGSDDIACDSTLPSKWHKQVREVRLPSRFGRGPTHARYIASKLWDGEEFYFQIDSHSHFRQGWDDMLIDNIDRLPNPQRSILSHYPPGAEEQLTEKLTVWVCSSSMSKDAPAGLFIQESNWCYEHNRSPGIAPGPNGEPTTCVTALIGGGFLAGRAQWIVDVPFDKYLPYLFHGEELLVAARLYTYGWDSFVPIENLIDHKYGGRPKNVYAENPTWRDVGLLSQARARFLLGNPTPADANLTFDKTDVDELGMGSQRSLEAFQEFAGIDLISGNSTSRCEQKYDWKNKVWVEKAVQLPW